MKYFFKKLFLECSMDDHTKDSKKSPIYQFQLFVIIINLFKITIKKNSIHKIQQFH
jgi:hypothetical protein